MLDTARHAATDAFEHELLAAAPELMRLARRAAPDPNAAADLLQDTLLAAWEGRGRLREGRPMLPWLIGILRNHVRRRRRRRFDVAAELEVAVDSDPAEFAAGQELDSALHRAMARLPDDSRQLLERALWQGWTSAELGAELGISASAARSRLQGVLRDLRRKVSPAVGAALLALLAVRVTAAPRRPTGTADADARVDLLGPRTLAGTAIAVTLGLLLVLFAERAIRWTAAPPESARSVARATPTPAPDAPRSTTSAEPVDAMPRHDVANASANATASLELAARWTDTGAPAANTTLRVSGSAADARTGPWRQLDWREVRLDEQGRARLDDLPPGAITVIADDGRVPVEQQTLAAGRTTSCLVWLKPECRLFGTVVDPFGRPVAGATLWLSSTGGRDTPGYVAAHTDDQGRFAAVAMHPAWTCWARADGFGPSEIVITDNSIHEPQRTGMILALTARPTTVKGLVQDVDGPLPGALVAATQASVTGPVLYTTTDEAGRFRLDDLPRGPLLVAASAAHRAPSWSLADPAVSGLASMQLTLGAGTTVTARIEGPWERGPAGLTALASPEIDGLQRLALLRAEGTLDDRAELRIEHAALGALDLRVVYSEGRNPPVELARGRASATGPDTRAVLHATDAGVVLGRVVDRDGRPLAGARVSANPAALEGTPVINCWVGAISRRDGSFRIAVPRKEAYRVVVFADPQDAFPIAEARAWPDQPVVVEAERAGSAFVTGRLAPSGRPWPPCHVTVTQQDQPWAILAPTDADGRFRFGPLPPGHYRVQVDWDGPTSRKHPPLPLATLDLRAGEERVLPEVTFGIGGLRLVTKHGPNDRARELWFDEWPVWCHVPEALPLAAGTFDVRWQYGDCRTQRRTIVVRRGAATELELPSTPARAIDLIFPFDGTQVTHAPGRLRYEVTDASGATWSSIAPVTEPGVYRGRMWLAEGTYSTHAVTAWGGTASGSFQVVSDRGPALEVRMPLAR